jgi:hypothetical protein
MKANANHRGRCPEPRQSARAYPPYLHGERSLNAISVASTDTGDLCCVTDLMARPFTRVVPLEGAGPTARAGACRSSPRPRGLSSPTFACAEPQEGGPARLVAREQPVPLQNSPQVL